MRTEQEIQKRIEHLEHEIEVMKSTKGDYAGFTINWGPHIVENMRRIELLKWVLTSREDDIAAAEKLRQLMHEMDAANGQPRDLLGA